VPDLEYTLHENTFRSPKVKPQAGEIEKL